MKEEDKYILLLIINSYLEERRRFRRKVDKERIFMEGGYSEWVSMYVYMFAWYHMIWFVWFEKKTHKKSKIVRRNTKRLSLTNI